MAYGMSAAKEAGLAQTQVWKRLMGMPVDQLKAAAHGDVPGVDMNLATLALRAKMTQVADKGVQAQQQLAQSGQGSVKGRLLASADQLPEMLGIGRLPAPNMEEVAAAQGGVMSYASGGEVAHFADTGAVTLPEGYEMYEDPTSGEVYPRKKIGPLQAYGQSLQNRAQGILPVPSNPAATPAATPAAPAAKAITEAPGTVKKATANLIQPKAPVEDPTPAQKSNLDRTIADTEKLYDYLDKKFGDQMSPIKAQLEKDREDYKTMKSENVGLTLLAGAGRMLRPGQTTATAIGGTLEDMAVMGAKFQPQLLAARQGISAGEVGLAQAQAQAARGNFATAAQMTGQEENRALQERELAMKEKYYGKMGDYYAGRGAGAGAGTGLANIRLQAQLIQNRIKQIGIPQSEAQRLELRGLEQRYQALISGGGGSDLGLSGALSKLPPGAVLANQ